MSNVLNVSISRRKFLATGAAGAGVFVLGVSLPMGRFARASEYESNGVVNAFIGIDRNGAVTFQNPFVEMGQGTYTSIPAIVAEELDVEMSAMQIVQAPHGPDYKIMFGNTVRFTGGSFSIRSSYDTMRKAGATARAMLIRAAADEWNVAVGECSTEPGQVVHKKSGKKIGYGELAPAAAKLEPPAKVKLKNESDFRLIGKPVKRTDSKAKVLGQAEFGMDVRVDGMLYAAIRQSPVFDGTVKSFDKSKIMNEPGVIAVESLGSAVAVIADHFWHAKSALAKLPVEFDPGAKQELSGAGYLKKVQGRVDEAGVAAENVGDVDQGMQGAASTLEAEYHSPLLAHATLEPMNCTALVEADRCIVWAPNQGADFVAGVAATVTGLPPEAIEVRTPYLGGGFGRRFMLDYVAQAVTLASKHKGKAIKLIWTREEDTQHDFYRPITAAKYRAAFDAKGKPTVLHITNVGDGPIRNHFPSFMENPEIDDSVIEGAAHQPYEIAHKRVDYVLEAMPFPIGFWRSVGSTHNAFFKESFMDEMAHHGKQDPVAFRRDLMKEHPRYKKVLDTAVKMAGWKAKPWQGKDGRRHAMGVALHESFNSIVAQIADISIQDGTVRVHKVWCAVDCGFAINPAIVVMQMESGIAYGLSATLAEEVTVEGGKVLQSNFHNYKILSPQEMPEIAVEIINSGEALGGIGEPGTPPIAPAVCNAVYTLTGERIRKLPLSNYRLKSTA